MFGLAPVLTSWSQKNADLGLLSFTQRDYLSRHHASALPCGQLKLIIHPSTTTSAHDHQAPNAAKKRVALTHTILCLRNPPHFG